MFEHSSDAVDRYCRDSDFPVVLKGIDGGRLYEASGFKMIICETPQSLRYWFDKLSRHGADNLMLQEYIPGKDDTIWIFNGYFDSESRCLGGFTGRKIRQTPVHAGSTTLGLAVENAEVGEQTIHFMRAIGYTGVMDIGFRYDARDGRYKLLDPNPRVGGTFRLFVDEAGMDVVRMLYLDQTGQSVPPVVQRYGRKWVVEDKDIESTLEYLREGEISWFEWAGSLAGVEEAAWFAADDWIPFLVVLRRLAARVMRFPFRWLRRATNSNGRKSRA